MKLFSRLFSTAIAPETKTSRAYAAAYYEVPDAVWSPRTYESFSKEGYKINVVAYQAIRKIADSIGAMNWKAFDASGLHVKTHPFLALIEKPNPWQSGAEWWRAKISYLLLEGQGFDECVRGSGQTPVELWTLRPDRMTVKLAPTGVPRGYEYGAGKNKLFYPADPQTGKSDIRHVMLFDPLNEWSGQSPIEAAAYGIDQHNECMKWQQALIQNSARPSGAMMMDKETTMSDEQFQRLRDEVEQNFSGAANAGRPMLLEGGMKWQAMSFSPADMDILEQKNSAARDISLGFGVPPLLLNIPGDNTYSNYREARLGFFEDTVIPLANMLAQELNYWLSEDFGGTTIKPDYDSIEAIAEKRMQLWEMVDASDEITVNEARELKGYPALPPPLGNMLMADLRSSRRGHMSPKDENGVEQGVDPSDKVLGELAYGKE